MVGPVDVPIARADVAVEIVDMSDCTIFVTVSARALTLRNLRRCTVAAAPCSVSLSLEACEGCTISAAAPAVLAVDVSSSLLFVAARAPLAFTGASRDVRLGPYNAVGDGLVSGTSLGEWVAAGASCVRLDARTDAGVARAITPADFYWRFLPVPQRAGERHVLPHPFALPDHAPRLPPTAEAALANASGPKAQRAELLAQSKFVVRGEGRRGARSWGRCLRVAHTTNRSLPGMDAPNVHCAGAEKCVSRTSMRSRSPSHACAGKLCGRCAARLCF